MYSDRYELNKYPEFQKELSRKIISIFKEMHQELANEVLYKIDNTPDFEFNEKQFFIMYKNYIKEKIKPLLYYDSPDVLDQITINVLTIIGAEQSYVMFQFVLFYISLSK